MIWKVSVRVEDGEAVDVINYTHMTSEQWDALADMEESCNGGVWVNVEYDDAEEKYNAS